MIDIDAALAALSLDDKCALLEGASTWRTRAFPDVGIPAVKMSDGPNGVRGDGHGGTGTKGVVVPAGITLGATWDVDLVGQIGDLLGREAVRKGAHVLLGPNVNLHRTPVGGRTFECYSEDPELSGALAAAYVRGVQSHDVAVTVKHFVCNDTEIERMDVDIVADERTLRELYLRPFERAVKEADAWGIMSAYNRLDGDHCAENHRLLTGILRDEWGFDGVVVSDWFGVHHTVPAANAGLNVEMPGPGRVYGAPLADAVRNGEVDADQIDRLARDVLVLASRVRADERPDDTDEESVDDPAERALTRRAAIAGTVLLRNDRRGDEPVLPLAAATLRRVAVLGPNAVVDRSMGGGSASLRPFGHRTLLDALTDRIGPGSSVNAEVVYEPGVHIDRLTPLATGDQLVAPDGSPGLHVEYTDGTDWDGPAVTTARTWSSILRFFGSTPDGVDPRGFGLRMSGSFVPDTDGPHVIGVVSTGAFTLEIDGATVLDDPQRELPRSTEFFGYGSIEVTTTIDATAGVPVDLLAKYTSTAGNGFAALRVGIRSPEAADLLDRAIDEVAAADAAVVVVGTNDEWETEGFDRTTMDLPGRQDEMVRRAVAANPNTVVVVNAGSPVTMDWAADDDSDAAPAVLTSFFAGQEQAEALVDVILGDADPGGRLPTTFPERLADHPAYLHHQPDRDHTGAPSQRYGEGLFMGYRHYDSADVTPRFAFGHGLSYGELEWGDATVTDTGDEAIVELELRSVGARNATAVVQGYVAPVAPRATRPAKELKSWQKVVVAPGATTTVRLVVGRDAFHRWDTAACDWVVDAGDYDLVLAASAVDERQRLRVSR